MVLIMPEDLSLERRQSMAAYGAEIILTPARAAWNTRATWRMPWSAKGRGVILDQFANPGQSAGALRDDGPELARYRRPHHALRLGHGHARARSRGVALPEAEPRHPDRRRPAGRRLAHSGIASGRKRICRRSTIRKFVDRQEPVTQADAEHMARRMAREEGIFCGISAAGALAALRVAEVENATIASGLRPRRSV
jgi:cysteine synthase B